MPQKTQEKETTTKKTRTVKKSSTVEKSTIKKSKASKASKVSTKTTATKKASAKSDIKSNKNLLIVESPAKAKTIKKYLGEKFEVLSCKGHIRDLPASRLGVDIENEFKPEYIVSRKDGKSALIKELKSAYEKSLKTYLATDPDREGEAIAWHLANVLGIDENNPIRVTFNEITKNAVTDGIKNPRTINLNLFNAQQARRVLDRLVGYKISPFLWKKVKKGLSAGRVQSVATRLVVDREREIEAFVPVEYWNLEAVFENGKRTYNARFYGNKDGKIALENKEQTEKIISELDNAQYIVDNIKKQEKIKSPNPPFITSSLQQDASVRLNMRPQRTMSIAQVLYEGIDIKGHGLVGLITYMRTDSLRISDEAQLSVKNFINEKYGEDYVPKSPRVFKTKKNAQDAHEAIRPTDVTLAPELIKDSLEPEQYRLYKLIWERFVASQMASAVYDTISVDIAANAYIFKATDSKIRFPGFTVLYNYSEDADENSSKLPDKITEGDILKFKELLSEQKFTQPPSRYTEASLIRALEENGIGRPSTYAPTISTILERHYIEKDAKSLVPTQLGFITTDIMKEHFKDIVDVTFTADMEEKLDEIEDDKKTYKEIISGFYTGFEKTLKTAEENMDGIKIEIPDEESDVVCELCGRKMVYKISKFGKFLACPNYPECKNTKSIIIEAEGKCPVCGGSMLVKKSKKGRVYYSCSNAPTCPFMTWDVPTKETCPNCNSSLFKHFSKLHCLKEGCGYEQN